MGIPKYLDAASVTCSIYTRMLTVRAGTQRSQIIIAVNPGAVAIRPRKLNGVVPDCANLLQLRIGDSDKISTRAMSLAYGARTVSSEIILRILSDVTIVPGDAKNSFRFDVVYFSGNWYSHKTPDRLASRRFVCR